MSTDNSEAVYTFHGATVSIHHGLQPDQVETMRAQYGRNTLTPPPRDPWWKLLLAKFDDPTIRILLVAAVISVAMTAIEKYLLKNAHASFVDSIGIFFAVFLATLVGYFSERKSAREFELLNQVKDDIAIKVLRNGQIERVRIDEIVVGDVVRVDMGDKVPADGVLVDQLGLLIDEAMLTGESVPAEKSMQTSGELSDCTVPDSAKVYRGTMIRDGHGEFVVTSVGDATAMGKIAANLGQSGESENETPLTYKLSVLAKQISAAGVWGAILIFTVMIVEAFFEQSPKLPASVFGSDLLPPSVVLPIFALFLGYAGMRMLLRPFFRSMGMDLKAWWTQGLAVASIGIAAYVLLNGVMLATCGLRSGDQLLVGQAFDLLNAILLGIVVAVTIIVVAVPEGLPMMVTVSLALNMMKMAKQNCLVRKLIASETIGSATVICSDKTGTLTRNRMTPVWFWLGNHEYNATELAKLAQSPEWTWLAENIVVNTDANLKFETSTAPTASKDTTGAKKSTTANTTIQVEAVENSTTTDIRTIEGIEGIGNPTECALLKLAYQLGTDYRVGRSQAERVWELTHNSQRKMSVVMAKCGDLAICYKKGAPEVILQECDSVVIGEQVVPIEPYRASILAALQQASNQALRVIAFSEIRNRQHICPNKPECPEVCIGCQHRVFVGMVGISDPIREEVPQAVQTCYSAGIQVKMITGDAKPTAVAIARQAGILRGCNAAGEPCEPGGLGSSASELVLTSTEFAQVSDEDLPDVAERLKVLARSTPSDKLRFVKALHRQGEVVAMTGDGTNDAPALKFADVGLSMGISGTEVAKEASDIVLVDDNFKSIVTGVWWGRTLYQNIQRFLQFQLSVNVVALVCALAGPMVGIPLPFTVTQLLWINIIMDTFAAMALSMDPPRLYSMQEPPIKRDSHIITSSMGIGILVCSLYQVVILFASLFDGWFTEHDFIPGLASKDPRNLEALTVFFTIFVMFQFWHKFNCRALRPNESPFALLWKNQPFIVIVGLITLVQILMVECSGASYGTLGMWIGEIFRTTTLSFMQWVEITLLTATIIPVSWLARQIAARCAG